MSEEETKPKSPGCFARLFTLLLTAISVGLAVALCYVFVPQDLSDIKGYQTAAAEPPRDLKKVLENAGQRGFALTISEEELNGWLKETLDLKQGGLFAKQAEIKGLAVRMKPEMAEVVIERTLFGRPFTVSMFLRIEQTESEKGVGTVLHRDGGAYVESFPRFKKGGRFGKLVVPQGLLLLVMPSFAELSKIFPEEIAVGLSDMARVKIEEDGLSLDPRSGMDMNEKMILPGSF